MDFKLQYPAVKDGAEIEKQSLETIEKEAVEYEKYSHFNDDEKVVINRLIHTTSCFNEVLENIYFTDTSINHIKSLLKNSAKIIVDTNMIKSGLSRYYLDKHNNEVICYVNDEQIIKEAKEKGITRTYLAVKKALLENKGKSVILACGNAPTYLYSAIETLVSENYDLSNVAILAFPVGFINVVESKSYTVDFLNHFKAEGIVMKGRFGSSTMIVSCLHAIYRLIK